MPESLWPYALGPTRLLCAWDSPGKNTGVDCYALLWGIYLTQGSNLGLPLCRQILYCLRHQAINIAMNTIRCLIPFMQHSQMQHQEMWSQITEDELRGRDFKYKYCYSEHCVPCLWFVIMEHWGRINYDLYKMLLEDDQKKVTDNVILHILLILLSDISTLGGLF